MISARSRRSSGALVDRLDTEPHYTALAGRIIVALGGSRKFVVVTGDPPASPHRLSEALSALGAASRAVINVCCGPQLTRNEVWRPATAAARLPATLMFQTSQLPAVLFVFDNAGRLSNGQIKDIYEAIQHRDSEGAAGVLLARSGFLVRLAAPGLMFLKEGLAGQFNFRDIGKDESIEFPRSRRANRGPRNPDARGALRGVSSFFITIAVLVVAGIAAFVMSRSAEQAGRQSARATGGISSTAEASLPQSMPSEMTNEPRPTALVHPAPHAAQASDPTASVAAMTQPAQLPQPISTVAAPDPVQPAPAEEPSSAQITLQATPPVALSPPTESPAEIAALVARGDSFLSAADIASARLFYERAADAGDGPAAFRLGATFDPAFLDRAGMRGSIRADPEQAASWYRRARELGDAAGRPLKSLDRQRLADPSAPAR